MKKIFILMIAVFFAFVLMPLSGGSFSQAAEPSGEVTKASPPDKEAMMKEGSDLVEKGTKMVDDGMIMKEDAKDEIGKADKMLQINMADRMIEEGLSTIERGNKLIEQSKAMEAGKAPVVGGVVGREAIIKEADVKISEGQAMVEKSRETGDYRMKDAGRRMIRDGMIMKRNAGTINK